MVNEIQQNVLISWSQDRSKRLAELLAEWLPQVFQAIEPWLSQHNISGESVWAGQLSTALTNIELGIFCITAENVESPWINFEAGALASKDQSRIFILLLDHSPEDIKGPLTMYQLRTVSKDTVYNIVKECRDALSDKSTISQDVLRKSFEKWWPEFDEKLSAIKQSKSGIKSTTRDPDDMIPEILNIVRDIRKSNITALGESPFTPAVIGKWIKTIDKSLHCNVDNNNIFHKTRDLILKYIDDNSLHSSFPLDTLDDHMLSYYTNNEYINKSLSGLEHDLSYNWAKLFNKAAANRANASTDQKE